MKTIDKAREPRFGERIRALRLGFQWSERLHAFMRISPAAGMFCVELYPPMLIPSPRQPGRDTHYCWWDDDEGDGAFIDRSPTLLHVEGVGVSEPMKLYLNEDGLRA